MIYFCPICDKNHDSDKVGFNHLLYPVGIGYESDKIWRSEESFAVRAWKRSRTRRGSPTDFELDTACFPDRQGRSDGGRLAGPVVRRPVIRQAVQ